MNRKRKQIYEELQQTFNLTYLNKDWLEWLLNFLVKNYSKGKHKSLLEFIKTIFPEKEFSKDETIDQLLIENQELKANLDGISLSHNEDEKGEIHYALANNPYANQFKEALDMLNGTEHPAKKYTGEDFKEMTQLALEIGVDKAAKKIINKKRSKNPHLKMSVDGFKKMWRASESYYTFLSKKGK